MTATTEQTDTTWLERYRAETKEGPLMDLVHRMLGDLGAAASGALVVLGDRLGIYRSLAKAGPLTSAGLAKETGLEERYLREWLSNQAASGYINYDADSGRFHMAPEQVAIFADPDSPVGMTGGYYALASTYQDESKVARIFQSGDGLAWEDHHDCLFCGTEKFFRPGYAAHLVGTWIPALDGINEKLVEPMAGDKLEDNLNPVGRLYYAFSTMVCTPGSRSQEIGAALGAQAGESRLRSVAQEGGFTGFRRVAETPFNMILEAKK